MATETLIAITQDFEVTEIDQVEIKKRIIEEKHTDTTYTLPSIDEEIAKKQARIDHLNGDIAELQALRTKLLAEVKKVKLRVDEVIEDEEEIK